MDELEIVRKICDGCAAKEMDGEENVCPCCAVYIAKGEIRKLQEQKKKQDEKAYWIKEMELGCRMWKCPRCKGRIRGNYYDKDMNPYHFCPYCGKKLATRAVGHLDRRHDREGG